MPDRPGGREIDYELEKGRLLKWELCGIVALPNVVDQGGKAIGTFVGIRSDPPDHLVGAGKQCAQAAECLL